MQSSISFVLDGNIVTPEFGTDASPGPTTTVLNYLRSHPSHTGVKEGCAEGDCGACTVVIGELGPSGRMRYKAVDSCLVFLPMLHGKQLITVENLKSPSGKLHPVQESMVDLHGSQCGFCTPGIVTSLFALYKSGIPPTREEIDDALTGNLCRCTGYKPIIEAAAHACARGAVDHFTDRESETIALLRSISRDSVTIECGSQRYHRPASLEEALVLRREFPKALIINGATDSALRVTKNHEVLPNIVDLGGIEALQRIEDDGTFLRIGAGITMNDLRPLIRKEFPALDEMLSVFGSRQIRNLATLGGNIGTGSPIGDMLPLLIAYQAKVTLADTNGAREIDIDRFFTGYRQSVREQEELITGVVLPRSTNGVLVRGYKVSKRKDLDISTVSGGFRLELNGGRTVSSIVLAYGGMADHVKRAALTEDFLRGKAWERDVIEEARSVLDGDFTPISDARGSAEMRRIAARNLLLKFWSETE